MARLLATELENVKGGCEPVGPTAVITNGSRVRDITNLQNDNDGPLN